MILLYFVSVTNYCSFEIPINDEANNSEYKEKNNLYQTTHITQKLKHALNRPDVNVHNWIKSEVKRAHDHILFVETSIVLIGFSDLKNLFRLTQIIDFKRIIVCLNLAYFDPLILPGANILLILVYNSSLNPIFYHLIEVPLGEIYKTLHFVYNYPLLQHVCLVVTFSLSRITCFYVQLNKAEFWIWPLTSYIQHIDIWTDKITSTQRIYILDILCVKENIPFWISLQLLTVYKRYFVVYQF